MNAMKTTCGNFIQLVGLGLLLSAPLARAQTNLQLTGTTVTVEKSTSLAWQSEPGAIYRIEYTPTLLNSNNVWTTINEDYPSHGTNTFWLDTGNYFREPAVQHPKNETTRFYRVVKTGTNTAAPPSVSIISPGTTSVLSREVTVTVSASTSLLLVATRLYVDGEEIDTDDGTNYVINTTEWANGNHILFATAKADSDFSGVSRSMNAISNAFAVSAYIPVVFSNYISRIGFSEHFFEPDLGQTQKVTAVFNAYSAWTLEIVNDEDTTVRTATGTGYSLDYDWNGTGDSEASIPNGVYYYIISAEETNAPPAQSGGGGGSPPSPNFRMGLIDEKGDIYDEILLPPLPPGFEAQQKSIFIKRPPVEPSFLPQKILSQSFGGIGSPSMAAMSSSPKTPRRPPTKPVKGSIGTFGVAYYTYKTALTNVLSPPNGLTSRVALDGSSVNSVWDFPSVLDFKKGAEGFAKEMTKGGWKQGFNKSDQNLLAAELKRNDLGVGGSNIFNQVNVGLFMAHGNYGSSIDFSATANQSLQTYFCSGNTNDLAAPWIRLSEFKFGNNLRWMGLLACNSLRDANWQSMNTKFVLPHGDQNHLVAGCSTYAGMTEELGGRWAKNMIKGQTIPDAWINMGIEGYKNAVTSGVLTNDVYFRVSGWDTCFSDRLKAYTIRSARHQSRAG